MQNEIIAAIAAYLERNEDTIYDTFRNKLKYNKIAAEIAAAIAPLVEVGEPDWRNTVEVKNESTYTFNLVISGVVVGYASKAGLNSKYTFHPRQYLALSAAHLDAISAVIKHYNK